MVLVLSTSSLNHEAYRRHGQEQGAWLVVLLWCFWFILRTLKSFTLLVAFLDGNVEMGKVSQSTAILFIETLEEFAYFSTTVLGIRLQSPFHLLKCCPSYLPSQSTMFILLRS